MRNKIFKSLFLLALTALLLASVLFLWITSKHITQENFDNLKNQAQIILALHEEGKFNYANLQNKNINERITILAPDGKVLFDNYVDASALENHLAREEVQQALKYNEGYAIRMSDTLDEEVTYYAVKMPEGNILRFAETNDSILIRFASTIHYLIAIWLLLIVLAYLAAKSITAHVVRPLQDIDLEQPLLQPIIYPELHPLLERIALQQTKLDKEMRRYKNKKKEMKAVTNNMNEGLIVLGSNGEILSINKSGVNFFAKEKQELIGQNILILNDSPELEQLLNNIIATGKGSALIEKGSSYYQLNGSKIGENGIVLIIMDVTEKTASEKLRREFSANVSHELKTPLQSILGYSEIMLSGLVKKDDSPRFLQKIYDEAKNLLHLIDDIIKLSKLEEHNLDTLDEIDLKTIAQNIISRLQHKAAQNNIRLTLNCPAEKCSMIGITSMIEETFSNLIDNAIKYNNPGGSVNVAIVEKENKWVISVADTGMGIAPEEKDRIFERFYRIDKSRHKAVEGTGLGLSIVKHSIMYHKGSIKINSSIGRGTTFIIKLPKNLLEK